MSAIKGSKALTAIVMVSTLFSLTAACHAQNAHRNPRVEALLKPLGRGNSRSVYTPNKTSVAYKRMAAQLKNANAVTLQLLMSEVTNIGALEEHQPYGLSGSLAYRAYRLYEAFQIAGTNAAPLIPQLQSEFLSGKSIYGAESGLVATGERGWSVLLRGLTNSDLRVQVAAAAAMGSAEGSIASIGFPYLFKFATNKTASAHLQRASVASIIDMPLKAKVKIPILIQVASENKNVGLRCVAIKAIGQLGIDNRKIRECLEQAINDKNHFVRLAASTARKDLDGN